MPQDFGWSESHMGWKKSVPWSWRTGWILHRARLPLRIHSKPGVLDGAEANAPRQPHGSCRIYWIYRNKKAHVVFAKCVVCGGGRSLLNHEKTYILTSGPSHVSTSQMPLLLCGKNQKRISTKFHLCILPFWLEDFGKKCGVYTNHCL